MIRCFIQNSLTHWTRTQKPCPFLPPSRNQTPCIHFLSFMYRSSSTDNGFLCSQTHHKLKQPQSKMHLIHPTFSSVTYWTSSGHLQPAVLRTLTLAKRPWRWERLRAGGVGDDRGWDGWMASPTQWTWVWVDSGSCDGQGGLACCDSWGRKESDDWVTELNWTKLSNTRPTLQSGAEYLVSFTEYCTKREKQNGCMGSERLRVYQSFTLVAAWALWLWQLTITTR